MNAIQCHSCWGIAISKHVYDFVSCPCGDVCVDGGPEYNRRVYETDATWTELTNLEELQRAQILWEATQHG